MAIILIIAAIAIPNLLKSRIAANEASAVGSVRTLNTGQVTYDNLCQVYSPDILSLNTGGGCAAAAQIIDPALATNQALVIHVNAAGGACDPLLVGPGTVLGN